MKTAAERRVRRALAEHRGLTASAGGAGEVSTWTLRAATLAARTRSGLGRHLRDGGGAS